MHTHSKRRNPTTTLIIQLFAILTLVFFWACSGSSEEKSTETTTSTTTETETQAEEATETAESDNGVIKLVINSDDLMRFDQGELRVKAGATVELTLNHTGQLPKTAMGHNVVILKPGTDIATFAQSAAAASENEYIPEGDDVIVHTALIGGGESTSITFEAPAAGTYDFICSFPGHYALMQGKFIVE